MPESEDLLSQALTALEEAKAALSKELARSAAREAYSCCLSVAQARIFEARQVVPKTHTGARTTISDIARTRPEFPQELAAVLAEGYKIKSRIDYGPPIQIDLPDAARRVAKAEELYLTARTLVVPFKT
jgi:uncharacterized protein (UPF0332 family)